MIIIEENISKKIENIIIEDNNIYIKLINDITLSLLTELSEETEISGFLKIYEIEQDKSNHIFDWVRDDNTNKIKLIIKTAL